MGEGKALSLLPSYEQDGSHRGRHPRADRRYVTADVLHRVIDPIACVDRSSGRVDINGYVLPRITTVQEEKLCLDYVCRIVIDPRPEEDDTIHHQSREDVHLSYVHRAFFDDRGRDIATLDLHIVIQCRGAHP